MTPLSGHCTREGLPLHYLRWHNDGAPPLVLLHGLRAYARWFEEFAEAAAVRYDVIALDQRGRGQSGWAADGRYDTDAYMADLHALVEQLGLERFTLLGHSMGGTNVVNYTAAHPARVEALVIVDSAPVLDLVGLTRIREEMGRTPARFATAEQAQAFLHEMHPRAGARSLATRLDWMLRPAADGGFDWRIDPAIFDPRMKPDPPQRMWNALTKVVCPTLLVRGAISDLITREVAQQMIDTLAAGELVEIDGAAHMVVEDNPHDFTTAVLAFLDRTTLSGRR